jgi:preprotein translocase subunit SecF
MTDTIIQDAAEPVSVAPRSVWHRLYHGETTFDFIGKRKIGFTISAVLLVITLVSLLGRGLNLGLDFKGGSVWDVPAKNGLTVGDVKSVLEADGIKAEDAKIQTVTGASGARIRVQIGVLKDNAKLAKIGSDLAAKAGITDIQEVAVNTVSSTWGKEITNKAISALIVFFVALTIYIRIRFEWKMAIAAFIAVVHDVAISVGAYSLFGFTVAPATVIAFLTILGFSLYDTIVVFDKVHENTRKLTTGRYTYGDVVNLSMNQTLMRSINTTLAAVLPVLSLLVIGAGVMGAVAIKDFALALFVGLLVGAYSSIFIATPILWFLKNREPRNKALETRLGRGGGEVLKSRAVAAGVSTGAIGVTPAGGSAPVVPVFTHPPRPRKKKRR